MSLNDLFDLTSRLTAEERESEDLDREKKFLDTQISQQEGRVS